MPGQGNIETATSKVMRPAFSPLFLPENGALRRLPRAPKRRRPSSFMAQFEDRALFYDCFWHADAARVLLIGPPPLNLAVPYQAAKFTALPTETELQVTFHLWRSTLVTELSGVPAGTKKIRVQLADVGQVLPIQPNFSPALGGRRLLFTMNKDNELGWIREWAHYHVATHGVDAVILFDNGSTRYGLDELEANLAGIPGLSDIVICKWPHKFGTLDRHVVMHRFWAHFLQISAMTETIRRFGAGAEALLNCDIDELVAPIDGGTVFDLVAGSPGGLVRLDGTWVTSAGSKGQGNSHFDYQHILRDPFRLPSPAKWAIDPKRNWVQNLDVMASWHRVQNAPVEVEKTQPHGKFWHFAGINSNWKSERRHTQEPNALLHRKDPQLSAARSGYFSRTGRG